jgi:hypothetical protein
MSFTSGHGATTNLVTYKLNSMGNITPFSWVQNDPDHLRWLADNFELAQFLASIVDDKGKESASHKVAGKAETRLLAPAAK